MAFHERTHAPDPAVRWLLGGEIDWSHHAAPELADVLELTFPELPDAYRDAVAWLRSSRLLNSELLTALREMTHERDQLRNLVHDLSGVIRQLRQSR